MQNAGVRIAFQGSLGAYSDVACREAFPACETVPCASFEEALQAVREKKADHAIIPIENTSAGRVVEAYRVVQALCLRTKIDLFVVGEHYQKIVHQLMVVKGGNLERVRYVHSHLQALLQCRTFIAGLGLRPVPEVDTAGAAAALRESSDFSRAVIASALAARTYGLDIVRPAVQDNTSNVTRFLIFSRSLQTPARDVATITSFAFRVRSVPAALYKALGGFATNGINLTRLESHVSGEGFRTAQFFVEFEGHPQQKSVQFAMNELRFFSSACTILGCYPAHPYRRGRSEPRNQDGDA